MYPVPGKPELPQDDPRLGTGKYEPLVHINTMLTEEVQRVMTAASGGEMNVLSMTIYNANTFSLYI